MTRKLARMEGVFAGGSSGSAVPVALECASRLDESALMVVIIADSGTRYLSKIYNDNWMREIQYFEQTLNIRASEVVESKKRRVAGLLSIPLATSVQDAVSLMREHAISQIPIIESDSVVGSISEARILDTLIADPAARNKPVAEYMEEPFPVLPKEASINMVAEHMKQNTTAVLVQLENGFDIITKSDLILFLTRLQSTSEDPLR